MRKHLILQRLVQIAFACIGSVTVLTTCTRQSSNVDRYQPAPAAYAILAEKSLDFVASLNVESWGAMLSDSVVYYFPDGDLKTCTKIKGKKALMEWASSHIASSGIQSMSIENATYLPVNFTGARAGRLAGPHVIAYLSNKMLYDRGAVSVRMNVIIHFDRNKMIDAYYTYYDNTPIMKVLQAATLPKL
jgi:hypothetical protein